MGGQVRSQYWAMGDRLKWREGVYKANSQGRVQKNVEEGQNTEKRVQHLVKHGGAPRQLWGSKE